MRLARAQVRRTAVREVAALAGGAVATFCLGVVMTRHLSPLYWAQHDKETVGLLAPAVITGLVGAVVIWISWGPSGRREQALALVPRMAWGVAGLIVFAAIIGASRPLWLTSHHLIAASFTASEAALQKADHLKIDGTRDYAENSLTWIGWYYGIVVVVAGVLGSAWLVLRFGRTGRPALLGFLLVFLGSAVLFLIYPNIAPDQIWVMRRYLPIVIPGFLIAASYLGYRLMRYGWAARVGAAVMVLASFAIAIQTSSHLARVRQAVPELAEVQNLCANLPDNAAVLVVGGLSGPYPMTLRSYCRVPVAQSPTADAATLAEVRKNAAAHGKELMVLANATDDLPAGSTVSPVSKLTIEQWNTVLERAAHASGHPVRSMYLGAVNPDGTVTTPSGQHVLTN